MWEKGKQILYSWHHGQIEDENYPAVMLHRATRKFKVTYKPLTLNLVKTVRGREVGELKGYVKTPFRILYSREDFESRLTVQSDCKSFL